MNAIWLAIESYVEPSINGIADLVDYVDFAKLGEHMFIDVDLLYSLQILSPRNTKQKIINKQQKSSLYELVNYTVTKEGSRLLRDWVRKPLTSVRRIKERQNVIKILSDNSNRETRRLIHSSVKRMSNINSNLNAVKSGKVAWKCWNSVLEFLQNAISLQKHVRVCLPDHLEFPAVLRAFFTEYMDEFQDLWNFILNFIEVESSGEDGKVNIVNGIDQELDDLRLKYNSLDLIFQELGNSLAQRFENEVLNIVYIPQIGFLVSVEQDIEAGANENFAIDGWIEVFRTETHAYYKSEDVISLDDQYGDIFELIRDREIEIIQQLLEKLLVYEEPIIQIWRALVVLDCLCSLAEVSQLNNYVCPEIVNGDILEIAKGRHPLVETSVDMFVPNDTIFSEQERIMVVTGANLSGKSVYLCQTALIVVLAQVGCFVPAESVTMGIFDSILTRIMSRESLDKQQSTFAIDLFQLSKCISLCTRSSLLIIDEFGKGSDAIDSCAIFGAMLSYFQSKEDCPRCLFSTHFHELFKSNDFGFQAPIVKKVCMDILLDRQSNTEYDVITYLYQIRPGVIEKSFGIYCAKICGVPMSIVARADDIANKLQNGVDLVSELMMLSEQEEVEFRVAKSVVTRFLLIQFDDEPDQENLREFIDRFQEIFDV